MDNQIYYGYIAVFTMFGMVSQQLPGPIELELTINFTYDTQLQVGELTGLEAVPLKCLNYIVMFAQITRFL
jgi:hypothetical protein